MTDFERLAHQQPAPIVYSDAEAEVVRRNGGMTRAQFAAELNEALGLPPPLEKAEAGPGYLYRRYVGGVPTQETSNLRTPTRNGPEGRETWVLERQPDVADRVAPKARMTGHEYVRAVFGDSATAAQVRNGAGFNLVGVVDGVRHSTLIVNAAPLEGIEVIE